MPEPTPNLFLALRKRVPGEKRDHAEDYLTEAFAWLLQREAALGPEFVGWIADQIRGGLPFDPQRLEFRTQLRLDKGLADMVAISDQLVLVFEHKLWAPLKEGQPEKYRAPAERIWPGRVRTVLITGGRDQHTQPADLAIVWRQVYAWLEGWLSRHGPREFVGAFLGLLRSHGFGPPAPVSRQAILGYRPGPTLEPALSELFRELAARWRPSDGAALGSVLRGGKAPWHQPVAAGKRWGRLGLDFPSDWRPGLFVGVMLDGSDHYVGLSDEERGPDFSLILSYHRAPGTPTNTEYLHSLPYSQLRERLRGDSGHYHFVDHYFTAKPCNEWHPLHLRRPLLDVLAGTVDMADQVTRMHAEACDAIELLLAAGELQALQRTYLRLSTTFQQKSADSVEGLRVGGA